MNTKNLIEDLKPIAKQLIELLEKHNVRSLDVWTTNCKDNAMVVYKDAEGNCDSSFIHLNQPQHCEELEGWE